MFPDLITSILRLASSTRRLGGAAAAALLGLASGLSPAQAADGTWNANASGNWSDAANWLGGTVADGATFSATFDAALSANRTVTLDTARTIGSLSFNDSDGGNSFIISGGNTLTLDADGAGGGISTIDVSAGTSATLGGSSLILAGSSAINKTGAGTLTLSNNNAANNFTGTFTLSNGTLNLGSNSTALTALRGVALTLGGGADNVTLSVGSVADGNTYQTGGTTVAAGGAGAVTISYGAGVRSVLGGTLTLNKDVTINSSSGPLQLGGVTGGGRITKIGGGAMDLTTNNSGFSGGITLSRGSVRLHGNAGAAGTGGITVGDANTGSNNTSIQVGGQTFNTALHFTNNGTGSAMINNLNGQGASGLSGGITLDRNIVVAATSNTSQSLTVSGTITGTGGIHTTSAAGNRVIISGNNSFSGGTTIGTGNTRTNNANALSAGPVTLLPGTNVTLDLNSTNLAVDSLSNAAFATAPSVTDQGSGYTTATVNISAPEMPGGTQATATATVSGGKVTGVTITNFGSGYTSAPVITISGDGTGATATSAFDASNITLATGTLALSGTNANPASYAGVISGTGNVIKNGSGTQILTGANTYTGTTTINAGSLVIDGSLASSAIAVNGGSLGGSGSIAGTVSVASGATLSPGNSPGLLTVSNNLSLNSGSDFTFELIADTTAGRGINFDGIDVTGSGILTIQTGVTANLVFDLAGSTVDFTSAFWDSNQSWLLFSDANAPILDSLSIFDTVNLSLDSLGNNFSVTGGALAFGTLGNDVYLNYTAVPEPSAWAFLIGGLGVLAARRRFRRPAAA